MIAGVADLTVGVRCCCYLLLACLQLLAEHANYHELCRLLGRLKTNYQLNELVAVDHYTEWIQLVAELTIESLKSWQWASTSVYYLLGLWSRLVSSMPYLKGVISLMSYHSCHTSLAISPLPYLKGDNQNKVRINVTVHIFNYITCFNCFQLLSQATAPACWRPTCPPSRARTWSLA